jgi:glycosyltransferase involved in cell wall biosynthesis
VRVLVVSPLLYHPLCGNGGGVISFNLIQGLSRRHRITFIGFGSGNASRDDIACAELRRVCQEVHVVPLPPRSRFLLLYYRLWQWVGGPPVDAQTYAHSSMHKALSALVQNLKLDCALVQFPYMAQYISDLGALPGVLDVQDVFFVSRLREYTSQRGALLRLKRLVAWLAWVRYESQWYPQFRTIMTLTEPDKAALQILMPGVPVFVNHAAIAAPTTRSAICVRAKRVGFGGNFGHPPNRDALKWLNEEIVPVLQSLVPDVEVVVAGKGLSDPMKVGLHPCITLMGFVEDYEAFMTSCVVIIAPLRFGGGVKIKILEALACGRPVVTTPVGIEGIDLGPEEGLMHGHSASDLAALVAKVLRSPDAAATAASRGADRIQRDFGIEHAVDKMDQEISALAGCPDGSDSSVHVRLS